MEAKNIRSDNFVDWFGSSSPYIHAHRGRTFVIAFGGEAVAELACLAVHPEYRNGGRGDALLRHVEQTARQQRIRLLFVLTARTAHWFMERGFAPADIESLPIRRRRRQIGSVPPS